MDSIDSFDQLIAQLEQVIATAKKSVFSGTDAVINRGQVLDIIDRIHAAYPDVMREAQYIVQDCDAQKQRALDYCNRILQEAEERRDNLLDENEIIKAANAEAAAIRKEALDLQARVEYDVKCKVDEVLKDSEVTLRDALTLIRNNREELRKTSTPDATEVDEVNAPQA